MGKLAGMTQQQQEAAMEADTPGFWNQAALEALEAVDELSSKMEQELGGRLRSYLSYYRKIIEAQGKELALFRTLEVYIRTEKLDETQLKKILTSLDELRAEVQANIVDKQSLQ